MSHLGSGLARHIFHALGLARVGTGLGVFRSRLLVLLLLYLLGLLVGGRILVRLQRYFFGRHFARWLYRWCCVCAIGVVSRCSSSQRSGSSDVMKYLLKGEWSLVSFLRLNMCRHASQPVTSRFAHRGALVIGLLFVMGTSYRCCSRAAVDDSPETQQTH